jgi:hypothetical protein
VRSLILAICLLMPSVAIADNIIIRNTAGVTVKIRVRNITKDVGIGKTVTIPGDNLFSSEVRVVYQSKTVASTTVKANGRDSKLVVTKERGDWFIKPDRYQ